MTNMPFCEDPNVLSVISFVKSILSILAIVVPIILIIMVTVEISKIVLNPDEKVTSKVMKSVTAKMIAAVTLFFVPTIVNVLMNMVGVNFTASSCWNNANEESIRTYRIRAEEEAAAAYQAILEERRIANFEREQLEERRAAAAEAAAAEAAQNSSGGSSNTSPAPSVNHNSTANRIVALANAELGNSWQKYINWYNNTNSHYWYDWCAVFVSYIGNKAGLLGPRNVPSSVIPKNSFVYDMKDHFIEQGVWFDKNTKSPMPGDIVFYNRLGHANSGTAVGTRDTHIAIVQTVNGNNFTAVHGNKGGGQGKVVVQNHRISDDYVTSFARPRY